MNLSATQSIMMIERQGAGGALDGRDLAVDRAASSESGSAPWHSRARSNASARRATASALRPRHDTMADEVPSGDAEVMSASMHRVLTREVLSVAAVRRRRVPFPSLARGRMKRTPPL